MLVNSSLLNPLSVAGVPGGLSRLGLSGVVYGVFGNDPRLVASLGDAVHAAPYKAPPREPVLYVKPRNTLAVDGGQVALPAGEAAYEIGACLGIVVGRTACWVSADDALSHVGGYIAVADLSLPQPSYYRPNLRAKARDGSCLLAAAVVSADQVATPDALGVRVTVDGQRVQDDATGGRRRNVAQLLADVSAFMTLRPGDLLLLGPSFPAPIAGAGQRFAVEIQGLPPVGGQVTDAGGAA